MSFFILMTVAWEKLDTNHCLHTGVLIYIVELCVTLNLRGSKDMKPFNRKEMSLKGGKVNCPPQIIIVDSWSKPSVEQEKEHTS